MDVDILQLLDYEQLLLLQRRITDELGRRDEIMIEEIKLRIEREYLKKEMEALKMAGYC